MSPQSLFLLVSTLVHDPALDIAKVRALLGGTWTSSATAYVRTDWSMDAPAFTTVRVDTLLQRQEAPTVVLQLAPGTCLTREALRDTFGFAAFVPVPPGAPTPPYQEVQYPQIEGAVVSASFDSKTGCLLSIWTRTRKP
jgi:hypothetical protein